MEQGELDGLMQQHPHLMHSRQQRQYTTQPYSQSSGIQLPQQPMQQMQPMQSHFHRQEHLHPSQYPSSGADIQSKLTKDEHKKCVVVVYQSQYISEAIKKSMIPTLFRGHFAIFKIIRLL